MTAGRVSIQYGCISVTVGGQETRQVETRPYKAGHKPRRVDGGREVSDGVHSEWADKGHSVR